jgi:hypothetical protein
MNRFKMISNNGGIFEEPTITLSTVELPQMPGIGVGNWSYESCVFYSFKESKVLARYQTRAEAIAGHVELEKNFNLS